MRRISIGMALLAGVITAAGCSGSGTPAAGATGSGAAKGVYGQYFYVAVGTPVGGTITSSDGLINCKSDGTGCGDATYHQTKYAWGTAVTFTATALPGYTFQGWAADCNDGRVAANVCALNGTDAGTDYTVVAVFTDNNAPVPPADATKGRVYGYVKDGAGKAAAGVKVQLGSDVSLVATTNAAGAYVVDAVPGTYPVYFTDNNNPALYTGFPTTDVTVPVKGGTGCVPSTAAAGGENVTGCLVRQDFTVANTGYVSPVTVAATASKKALVGFNQGVTLSCNVTGGSFVKWEQTGGPIAVDTTAWTATQAFTTPTLAQLLAATVAADQKPANCPNGAGNAAPNKVGCGVSNFYLEQRGGFLPINKQQSGELTYSFKCTGTDGAATPTLAAGTTSVQLVSIVNTFFDHLPVDTATGANDTSPRAYAPSGVVVIMDDKPGRATYTWSVTAVSPTPPVAVTINDQGTKNAWFVAPAQGRYTLKNDSYADATFDLRVNNWGGFQGSCYTCHDPASVSYDPSAPSDPVAEWKTSKHNHIVIDGMGGTHYSSSCLPCHTVGYDTAVSNNGWDDVAAAQTPAYKLPDFTFLGTDATLAFASMPAPVQQMSNVQCQSCHGAGDGGTAHHTGSLNARVCGTCHDGGHHSIYSQWRVSGHGNLAGAQNEGPAHGADQSHCARCHYAQGYLQYVPNLVSGNPDKLGNVGPSGSYSQLQPTGITVDNVEPVTCQTCHTPHSLELRVTGADTTTGLLLAGGFKIYNAGAGAICAGCHNSRNGILGGSSTVVGTPTQHNDATPLTSANFGMTGPHAAAQADVYFAGNGYLLGATMPSQPNYHQDPNWFKDTCVECHVKRFNTATDGKTVVNHSFEVDSNTCVGCHGAGSELQQRKALVANKLDTYLAKLAQVLNGAGIATVSGQLNGATYLDTTTTPATEKPLIASYTVTSSIVRAAVSGDRPLTLDLTFANGDTVAGINIDTVKMVDGTPVLYTLNGTTKVYGLVAKSMYDWALITEDNSGGVHNIPFVDAMLDAMSTRLSVP